MTKIISLGGSVIVPKEIDLTFLSKFKRLMLRFCKKEKIIIVCGGGKVCRKYISSAKKLSKPKSKDLDRIGIQATRLNAELIRVILRSCAHPKVTYDPKKKVQFKRILIAAGDKPGSSSDYDAVLLAKTYKCKEVINITNIDFIYDKDPAIYKTATPLKNLSWKQFRKIIGNKWVSGKNYPFDPVASSLASKLKIELKLLNRKNITNIENCLKGKKFKGSIVK